MLDAPSDVHVVLGTPGKACGRAQGKRVHVNACKPFVELSVHRVAVWAIEDELMEQQTRLLGKELSQGRKKQARSKQILVGQARKWVWSVVN